MMLTIVFRVMRLVLAALLLVSEALSWLVYLAVSFVRIVGDFTAARRSVVDGALRCPRGHPIPTEGQIYTCESCGFTYASGSIWRCANPECGVATPFVNCPTCGLSVRNPFLWGRP